MSDSSSGADSPLPRRVALLLALGHGGWIWWLSSQSFSSGGGPWWGFVGNSFHFALFGLLALLLLESCRRAGGWSRAALLGVLIVTVSYGIIDEWHQSFTPGRSPDPADVCVDLLGAVAAIAFWWGVRGPGRFRTAFLRGLAIGVTALGFNALRAFRG